MKHKALFLMVIMAALVAVPRADVLKLKKGPPIKGTLISANSEQVLFLGVDGKETSHPLDTVAGIDFAPPPPPPAAKAAPAAPAAARVMTIPTGTRISVRMVDSIDGKTAKAGMRYRATLDEPVAVGSQVAIPDNTSCMVEVVSVDSGDQMALRLHTINVGGKSYSTSTSDATVEATGTSKKKKAARRGVGLGAVGAGIGAIAGGGSGAAIGAVVGGTAGAVSGAAGKGKDLNVPSETRLLFSLTAPVPLN